MTPTGHSQNQLSNMDYLGAKYSQFVCTTMYYMKSSNTKKCTETTCGVGKCPRWTDLTAFKASRSWFSKLSWNRMQTSSFMLKQACFGIFCLTPYMNLLAAAISLAKTSVCQVFGCKGMPRLHHHPNKFTWHIGVRSCWTRSTVGACSPWIVTNMKLSLDHFIHSNDFSRSSVGAHQENWKHLQFYNTIPDDDMKVPGEQ